MSEAAWTRRSFLWGAAAFALSRDAWAAPAGAAAKASAVACPSYFDTRLAQVARLRAIRAGRAETLFPKDRLAQMTPCDAFDEISVFGSAGWAVRYSESVRKDLNFVLEGACCDAAHFPSFAGSSAERLRAIVKKLKDGGWRGACLRVTSLADAERTKRLISDCAAAGIDAWLSDDLGADGCFPLGQGFADWRQARHPALKLERPFCATNLELFATSDVVRVTALEASQFLRDLSSCTSRAEECGRRVFLNTGDFLYEGAALGHAFGVTRYLADGSAAVRRAVHWQTLAPAFAVEPGLQTRVGTAGSLARGGIPLPRATTADGSPACVLAAKNPNGALSVCSRTPQADVELDAALKPGAWLGVFGELKSLTLRCAAKGGGRPEKILVSDLAGGYPENVTANVAFPGGGRMTFDGAHLARLGRKCNRKGDDSPPAVLIRVT